MRIPILVCGVACVAACDTGPRAPDVVVGVSVSAAQITAGQPDTVVVTATNATDRVITLTFGTTCQLLPYIRTVSGQFVLPSDGQYICGQMETALQFQPRELKRQVYVWTGSNGWAGEALLQAVPAGDYEIYAEVRARELQGASAPVRIRLQ